MKVLMKTNHRELRFQEEYDLPEPRARALIRHGLAEAAVMTPPETATGRGQRKWPLKQDPEEYLKRYPDGKYADLARRHA